MKPFIFYFRVSVITLAFFMTFSFGWILGQHLKPKEVIWKTIPKERYTASCNFSDSNYKDLMKKLNQFLLDGRDNNTLIERKIDSIHQSDSDYGCGPLWTAWIIDTYECDASTEAPH